MARQDCFRKARTRFSPFFFFILCFICMLTACHGHDAARTWTVLIYMDAGNNLADAAAYDMAEMQAAGSSDKVRVIVELSLPDPADPAGVSTKRYLVHANALELLADLGNVSLADPQSLTGFLAWAKDAFPADRSVLILWDHGNGWDQGDGPSRPSPGISKSIFYDVINPHFMPNHEVRKAIEASGLGIDVLGMDACTMGTVETLYEFRNTAKIIISSEEVTENDGWNYSDIFAGLTAHPEMGIEDFARTAVESFKRYYENVYYPALPGNIDKRRSTLCAIRTGHLPVLAREIDLLAGNLSDQINNPATSPATLAQITAARDAVQAIDRYIQPYVYVDLVDLDNLLGHPTEISRIMADATIAEYHGSARPNAHGLSIVFFTSRQALTYDPNYRNYDSATNRGNGGDFINQFRWDEFLQGYYTAAGL